MNRKQRRAANKAKPAYMRMSLEARKAALVKNGITETDLKRNYETGFQDGYKIAAEDTVKGIYAALCLALKDLYGFGRKRCYDVLKATDAIMLYRLTGDDLIQNVWDALGLKLDFKDAMDRVQEKD